MGVAPPSVALSATRERRTRRPIFIWGAGAAGRAAAAELTARGVAVDGLVDRDPAKAGSVVDGCMVHTPDEMYARRPRPRVVIASMHWREIADALRAAGFRARRDFEVFDAASPDASGASALGSSARDYLTWREAWRHAMALAWAGDGPPVTVVGASGQAPGRGTAAARRRALGRLPAVDQWVVVIDDHVRHVAWRWRRDETAAVVEAAPAVYDWTPAPARAHRPFVLDALVQAAALAPPIVCRARHVRAYLAAPGRAWSLPAFGGWLQRRGLLADGVPAGAVEVRVRLGAGRVVPGRVRQAAAPGLVAFASALARSGRAVFSPDELAATLPRWTDGARQTVGAEYLHQVSRRRRRPAALTIYAHTCGNFFFTEIRDHLAATWRRAGARVRVADERQPPPSRGRAVVVAPHEFFELEGRHPGWRQPGPLVLVNTEQPQTRWFARCLDHLLAGAVVFDVNWQTALLLRTLGVNAHFLPLGWDPQAAVGRPRLEMPPSAAFDCLSAAERRLPSRSDWGARPIDVLFVGTLSPRRARAFAAAASALSQYRCFLHVPPSARPITATSEDRLDARDMADLCRRSKIVLNVHRDDLAYCEWHRVVFQAIRHGALVLTEPMMPVPGFAAGRDFVAAPLDALPTHLTRLLTSASGRRRAARVAARGRDTLRRRFAASRIAARSLELV